MTMTTTTTTNDMLPLRKAATVDGSALRPPPPPMPRLESLPPIPPILSPTLSADGSATPRLRLAPSVVRRPDALPLARMPSLATLMEQHQHALEQQALRTPTHRPRPSARSSLRVMPRLPLFGEDAPPQPTAVHEIDEEDDEDEDESSAEDAPTASFSSPVVDSELEADTDEEGGMVPASSSKTITLRPIPPPARVRTSPAPPGNAAWTLPPISIDAAPMDLRVPASPVDYFSQPKNASTSTSTSVATPAAMATPRPGLQRRVSRSMADLAEEAGSKRADALADRGHEGQSASPPGPDPPPVVQHAVSPCSPATPGSPSSSPTLAQMKATLLTEGPQLQHLPSVEERPQPRRRRSSMPGTIRRRPVHDAPSEPPPPYAPEDGKEELPEYSNSIYLAALVPRKQEFSAPRVLARDRRWRKVWLVLEGTALKMYRDRSSFSFGGGGASATEEGSGGGGPSAWRRSRINLTRHQRRSSSVSGPSSARSSEDQSRNSVGGDSPASSHTSLETGTGTVGGSANGQDKLILRHPFDAPSSQSQSQSRRHSMTPSPSSSSSMLASSTTNSHHRHSQQFQYSQHSQHTQQQQQQQHVFYRPPVAASPAASTVSLLATHTHAPAREPLRVYSMQHAESGLGSDYVKKPHVVRIRAEGEQFLIQLGSVEEVVQWVEGLQAAANIALDLDERQMPRGPLYPRRRRRRRRPDEVPNPGAGMDPQPASSSAAATVSSGSA